MTITMLVNTLKVLAITLMAVVSVVLCQTGLHQYPSATASAPAVIVTGADG